MRASQEGGRKAINILNNEVNKIPRTLVLLSFVFFSAHLPTQLMVVVLSTFRLFFSSGERHLLFYTPSDSYHIANILAEQSIDYLMPTQ